MPNYTEHHRLIKPFPEEFYNINEHNGNMDIIDAELKRLNDMHTNDMTNVNKALEDVNEHINNKNNPHGVTAEQVGAQVKNDDLTEYKNGVLRTIKGTEVKISSIEIGDDEPAEGDVWIDTDDDDNAVGGVESVNGQTGHVNLTARDVDAYPTGETYTKTEVNDLLKNKKHSADDIVEGVLPIERGGTGGGTATVAVENLGALSKSGGTMTGTLVAQNNTGYTTKQVRNIFLIANGASLPSGSNGDVCLVYTP